MSTGMKLLIVFLAFGFALAFLGFLLFSVGSPAPVVRVEYSPQREPRIEPGSRSLHEPSSESVRGLESRYRSSDGGVDAARGPKEAAERLADQIRRIVSRERSGGYGARAVAVDITRSSPRRKDHELLTAIERRLHDALRSRGIETLTGNWPASDATGFRLVVRRSEVGERLVELQRTHGGAAGGVLMRDLDEPKRDPMAWRPHQRTIEFISLGAESPEEARSFAVETLLRRLRSLLFDHAVARGWVDVDEEAGYREMLDRRYGRDLLVSLGETDLELMTEELGGTKIYRKLVTWRGDEHYVAKIASNAAHSLRAQKREPWIRLGLSLGTIILCVLSWLRIDWWLKGHYSWLTRVMAVLVTIVMVRLVWLVPFDV